MRWTLNSGNILDEPADVLVCSANVFLNLSGGVGGEILLRCGPAIQAELHRHLAEARRRFVEPGDVIVTSPHGLPFKAVLHAVAVDGFYQTSPERVRSVFDKSLHMAACLSARRLALAALATGYGRLTMARFAEAIGPLMSCDYPPLTDVLICVRNQSDQAELGAAMEGRLGQVADDSHSA